MKNPPNTSTDQEDPTPPDDGQDNRGGQDKNSYGHHADPRFPNGRVYTFLPPVNDSWRCACCHETVEEQPIALPQSPGFLAQAPFAIRAIGSNSVPLGAIRHSLEAGLPWKAGYHRAVLVATNESPDADTTGEPRAR